MNTRRFNGVPINLDSLSPEETERLAGYVRDRAVQVAGEMAVLRSMGSLPDNVFLMEDHRSGRPEGEPERGGAA